MKRRRSSPLAITALIAAPALLTAAGYWWWYGRPLRAQVRTTEEHVVAMQASLPSASHLQEVHARAEALRTELAAIVNERKPTGGTAGALLVPGPDRAQWRLLLSDVLQRHHLVLAEEERIDVQLPANIARGLFATSTPRTLVSAWSLRLRGGYLDLLAAVSALRNEKLPFHLLELGMKRDQAGAVTWTMVVG